MKSFHLFSFFIALLTFGIAIFLSCSPGADGEDGKDGQVIGGDSQDDDDAIDDDATDDDAADDDATDDDDAIDDDDDGQLTEDDLDYAGDCPELASCVVDSCQKTPVPESYALLECTLDSCPEDYEDCFGPWGEGACVQILKCLQACLPEDCLDACIVSASYDALMEFADVGICVEDNCPDALADPLGNIGCFTGVCLDPVSICCGGSLLGCM